MDDRPPLAGNNETGFFADVFQTLIPVVILAVVVVFLIRPYKWVIMKRSRGCKKGLKIWIDYGNVPLFSVLFLWAARIISLKDIEDAILGDEKSKPWTILILFFALVYMYISLDVTGIFDWISIRALRATGGAGKSVWWIIVGLSSVMTMIASNDVSILTITPIICAVANFTKIDPIPFLISEFFVANVWSMLLVIGNPTNIIVADAYGIQFLEYSGWMTFPTIVAGGIVTLLLYLRFRNQIPEQIELPADLHESDYLVDPKGAIYGVIVNGACLVCLVISGWIDLSMWSITLGFAFLMLCKDIAHDIIALRNGTLVCPCFKKKPKKLGLPESYPLELMGGSSRHYGATSTKNPLPNGSSQRYDSLDDSSSQRYDPLDESSSQFDGASSSPRIDPLVADQYIRDSEGKLVQVVVAGAEETKKKIVEKQRHPSNLRHVVTKLPWKIAIFIFCVFIIVYALSITGWTSLAARALTYVITLTHSDMLSSWISSFLVGSVSLVLMNVLNNQPGTILFTGILRDPSFTVSPLALTGAIYSVIITSNLGANFTLVGALAGILWSSIIEAKNLKIPYLQFAAYGFFIMPLVVVFTFVALCIELVIFDVYNQTDTA